MTENLPHQTIVSLINCFAEKVLQDTQPKLLFPLNFTSVKTVFNEKNLRIIQNWWLLELFGLRASCNVTKNLSILLMILYKCFLIFFYSFTAITLLSDFQVQSRCAMVYQMEIMTWLSIQYITLTTSWHAVIILPIVVHVLLLILLSSTVKRVINACPHTMLVSQLNYSLT